jgi:hypothetical protein
MTTAVAVFLLQRPGSRGQTVATRSHVTAAACTPDRVGCRSPEDRPPGKQEIQECG